MDQRSVRDILAGKTYFIRTFGCQMNQHDSERVSGLLDSYGCLMALDPEHADIVVFMTCCVRDSPLMRMSENTGAQEISNPVGIKKPRAIATAFMAWLTAPAPTH